MHLSQENNKKYLKKLETIVKNGKEYKQLPNYKTVEELLADKFVDFTIAAKELEGKQKSYEYLDFRSEVQKSMVTPLDILVGITKGTVKSKDAIAKQFVGMYKMLKGFYTKNSPNIDDLFENINPIGRELKIFGRKIDGRITDIFILFSLHTQHH